MAAPYEAAAMTEQSHREEMNAAIRAQRERQAAAAKPAAESPPPPKRKNLLNRLLGK